MTDAADDAQRRIANRLKRARGQLTAVIDAVEAGEDCRTVVTRLAAVAGAIDKAGFAVISAAMRECLDGDAHESRSSEERMTVAELEELFLTLS